MRVPPQRHSAPRCESRPRDPPTRSTVISRHTAATPRSEATAEVLKMFTGLVEKIGGRYSAILSLRAALLTLTSCYLPRASGHFRVRRRGHLADDLGLRGDPHRRPAGRQHLRQWYAIL